MNRPEELDRMQEYIMLVLNDIWEKMETADVFKEIGAQLAGLPEKRSRSYCAAGGSICQ